MTREFKFQFRILTAQSAGLELGSPPSLAGRPAARLLLFPPLALPASWEALHTWWNSVYSHLDFGVCTWAVLPILRRLHPRKMCAWPGCGLGAIWAGNSGVWRLSSERQTWAPRGSSSGCVHPLDPWGTEGHVLSDKVTALEGEKGPLKHKGRKGRTPMTFHRPSYTTCSYELYWLTHFIISYLSNFVLYIDRLYPSDLLGTHG